MRQHPYHLLLLLPYLAILITLASSLSPTHLSASLYLLPLSPPCALNFGKDPNTATTTEPHNYPPQSFFYDGERCANPLPEKASSSAAFVVAKSNSFTDIFPPLNNLADVIVLTPQHLKSSSHPRFGQTRPAITTIPCGDTAIREILFLQPTKNATFKFRGRHVRLQDNFLYAFVDHVPPAEHPQFRDPYPPSLCIFKAEFTPEVLVNAGKHLGKDRPALIAAGVFGVAVLAVILYGIVFIMYRKSVQLELSQHSSVSPSPSS